jgi:DNA-directed RNA polymerase specialized sigma subunit
MKATLEFDLSNDDDMWFYTLAYLSHDMHMALRDITQYARTNLKHGELTEQTAEALETVLRFVTELDIAEDLSL